MECSRDHIIWNFFTNSKIVQFVSVSDKNHSSIVMFRFKSDRVWITGGTFRIKVALPVVTQLSNGFFFGQNIMKGAVHLNHPLFTIWYNESRGSFSRVSLSQLNH